MSFFNTLQQYVTNLNNSVANLNISPRRFSLSGRESFDSASLDGVSTNTPPSQPISVLPYSSNQQQQPSSVPSPVPLRAHPLSLSVEAVNESPCNSPKSPNRASSRPLAPRSAAHLLQERSKSLKTAPSQPPNSPLSAKKSNTRTGSLKEGTTAAAGGSSSWVSHHHSPLQKRKEIKLLPTFARFDGSRRTAWPQFAITGSGVQEGDGSFFESFTALSWKQENRRLQVLREDEKEVFNPVDCHAAGSGDHASENIMSAKEVEQLYIEVLYTVRHKIGAHSAQYPHHYKEDLIRYAQSAFNFGTEQHRRCQAIASEEKPPIVVLNVVVIEAEGLEAKDPNGFSDPYCMLGIHPGSCKVEQQQQLQGEQQPPSDGNAPATAPNRSEERRDSLISMALGLDRQKKHHFRLSFKRKEPSHSNSYNSGRASISSAGSNCSSSSNNSREQRDSLHAALPAKFIRATSVKGQTLNPKWNEKFRFDIDDVSCDTLHLDIWDHDDEYSVLDAVSKLNEVRGVKGLGRFFKQIAQSARSGNQDDFLGCVNIPIQDIPSTGVESWYKLEGRSQRSTIQGKIRLKLFLSTREDLGTSEEDNWTEIKQQENLHCVFIDYELSVFKNPPWQWSGEMSQQALTILHQHAIQGDVTVLQSYVVRWIAFARKLPNKAIHFSVLYNILNDLESHWATEPLSREEEDALGESFKTFIEYSLTLLRRMRFLFNNKTGGLSRLEYLLKCLSYLESSRVFRRCCPFHKEIRGEVVAALRKGVVEWYTFEQTRCIHNETTTLNHISGLIVLTNRLYADLMRTLQIYDDMFQKIYSIPYFAIVYRSHIKTIIQDYSSRLEAISACFESGSEVGFELASPIFELHVALQDLQKLYDQLPAEEFQNHTVALQCHEWFRKPLEFWLILARSKALHRVRMAAQLDSHTNVEPYLIHSTSAIDTTSCFYQICEFWKQIAWPDLITAFPFVYSIVEMVTACATVYADLIFARVQATGFFSEDSKLSPLSADIYVPLNDLEHVKCALTAVPQTLQVTAVAAAVDNMPTIESQRSPVLGRSRSSSVASGAHIPSPSYLMIASTSCYESSARLAFQSLLETAREHYETKLLRICGCMAEKMRTELKKNIFHLAWSPDSLPAREAAAPLMECLDQLLLALEPNLLPTAFHRCVIALWDVLLFELWNQAEMSSGEKFCKFYERLHDALELLVHFLHAEGKGVPLEALRSPTYQRVEEKISLHKTKTEQLIDMYYMGRLEQQQQVQAAMDHTPYGVLSLRAYFHHDSLSVEIISARDVIPLDPNGLSDPFVIIEMLPRRVFTNCNEQQTSVRRRTLNPTFDECFEFPVTVEQCRQETSMLLFTVMDYDVLTANDFAGEALLSLNAIPGVAAPGVAQGFDNTFHGLKQIDLVLMHQTNKHHPILSALECRQWDRTAQEFVRKQKERISS